MNKETVTEIAKQLGMASKDVLALLARYEYKMSIALMCTTSISIVATMIFAKIVYGNMKDYGKDERFWLTTFAAVLAIIVCALTLGILASFLVGAIDPQAAAMHSLLAKKQ